MTCLRILKISFFVFLSIFLIVQVDVCDSTYRERRDSETQTPPGQSDKSLSNSTDKQDKSEQNKAEKVQAPSVKASDIKKQVLSDITSKSGENPGKLTEQNSTGTTETVKEHFNSLDAGALKRGFYVLSGLGVIILAYFVFRSFRVTNTRAQMIRKYGILAHRQDVEMRPLPLDEDDDDDTTVFDASNMPHHNTLQTSP